MNKEKFSEELRKRLRKLPKEDVESTVDYYCEMIDDRTDDGLSEEEAVAAIGTVEDIAGQILGEKFGQKAEDKRGKQPKELKGREIALIIIGAPLWLPILIAVAAVIFSIYVSVWSVVISLYTVAISLAASAVALIVAGVVFIFTVGAAEGIFLLGAALVCAGLAILMFELSNLTAKLTVKLGVQIWKGVKRCFSKKKKAQNPTGINDGEGVK